MRGFLGLVWDWKRGKKDGGGRGQEELKGGRTERGRRDGRKTDTGRVSFFWR